MSDQNLVINLDDAKDMSQGMPNGWYGALVEDAELTTSSKGAPMIKWTFVITDTEYAKRKLFYYTVLNQDFAVAALKKIIVCSGVQVDMAKFDVGQFCESGAIINMPLEVKVGKQKYEGEDRDQIKDFRVSNVGGGFQL